MVEIKGPAVTATERLRQDADKIPEFEHVEWRKDRHFAGSTSSAFSALWLPLLPPVMMGKSKA